MQRYDLKRTFTCIILLALLLSGCAPAFGITIVAPDGTDVILDKATVEAWVPDTEQVDDYKQVPLERILFEMGWTVLDTVDIVDADGQTTTVPWADIADDTWLAKNGDLTVNGNVIEAVKITPHPDARMTAVTHHLIDIAPTVAQALGIDAPEDAQGTAMAVGRHEHVLMLFLDAFGYVRYEESKDAGLIPVLGSLDAPMLATVAYPPATVVSSATVLTGAMPRVHGSIVRTIRKTETQTIFDVAAEAGLSVVAVEGDALSYNLRNAALTLSGDRNEDGTTDDNVLANALLAIEAGMPDLLWVHFHGIDDFGHTYGPNTPEESARIEDVDRSVGIILEALPQDTLVIIFADHGMHVVGDEGRLGNHGNLIPRDMYVPIFTYITD